jgi:hypothetical protein
MDPFNRHHAAYKSPDLKRLRVPISKDADVELDHAITGGGSLTVG